MSFAQSSWGQAERYCRGRWMHVAWRLFGGICAFGALPANCQTAPPPQVQVVKPVHKDVERRTTYPATLMAWQEVSLAPRASGEVVELAVDVGERVKKGQVLLKLDNPELEADVLAAQADVTEASATLQQLRAEEAASRTDLAAGKRALQLGAEQTQRLQALQRAQSATAKEAEEAQKYQIAAQANIEQATAKVDVARAKVDVAQARLQTAQAKLRSVQAQQGYLAVAAPFDGVVTARNVDIGAIVSPASAGGKQWGMLTIQDDSKMRVMIDVPEADAASARPGTSVDVTLDALRAPAMNAKISRTASALMPDVKTLRAQVDLENGQQKLMAGMFVHACLLLDVHKGVLAVASKAVTTKGGNSNLLIVADGKVKQVPVTTGYNNGTLTEIKSGLNGDEDVIISSRENLGNNMPVQIEDSAKGSGK